MMNDVHFSNLKNLIKTTLLGTLLLIAHDMFAQNSCLLNKDAGINANLSSLDAQYNQPSPYSYGEMIAVNDGGNRFYDYTSSYANPTGLPNIMLEITDVVRYFVQMQEDFAVTPDVSQVPAVTNGNPISMTANNVGGQYFVNNKATLQGLKDQGFIVHACFAALSPTDGTYATTRPFPEQWYFVNEWTNNPGINYEGVKLSVKNYTTAFINTMSPPDCTGNNCIVDVFEMGNEPWGYPDPKIYHAIITGAWEAFNEVYGAPANWKMKFVAPSFQAFRANILTCDNPTEINAINLQTQPNYQICQYDEIGAFLDLPCSVMDDISAINIHPYGFQNGNIFTFKTEPEHPESEFNQIKNTVIWRDANFPNRDMKIYSTEFGWSSQPEANNGNGEQGQAANLLRGILIQSRYHIARTYIYNAYEDGNILYNWHALYETGDSNGIGYNNSLGGRKKPAFFAVKDFKEQFGNKVFYQTVQEDRNGVYAYILTNPDGSDPYLVFWTPQETHDYNINDLSNPVMVNWSNVFPNLGLESTTATTFALDENSTNITFTASNEQPVAGSANIIAKRMPAYIKLVPVDNVGCNSSNTTSIKTGCGLMVEVDGLNVNFVSTTQTTNLIIRVRNTTWDVRRNLCNDYKNNEECGTNSSVRMPSTGPYIVDLVIQNPQPPFNDTFCTFEILVGDSVIETVDNDNDGYCNDIDCDDNNPSIGPMQIPGTTCDDGNANTVNDQIQNDGCTCAGIISNTVTGCDVTVEIEGLKVNFVSTTTGAKKLIIKVRTDDWQFAVDMCNDYNAGNECTTNSTILLPGPDEYLVDIQREGTNQPCLFSINIIENWTGACVPELNLNGVQDIPTIFRANSMVISTAEVDANVSYRANDFIQLNTGFKTIPGNNFKITVNGCE